MKRGAIQPSIPDFKEKSPFSRLIATDLNGRTYEIDPANCEKSAIFKKMGKPYRLLSVFILNELKGKNSSDDTPPKHIEIMRSHKLLDYCPVSEKGHMKWYPNGVLMQKLLMDYAGNLAMNWGAFEMKNPFLIRGDHNEIGELMGEFHERDYKVDGGRGVGYLRYASDPMAFPFMQQVGFNQKQSPLKVYEEAICFRNERQGEVSGLKRVRQFLMTDMHAACSSEEEAFREFKHLNLMFKELMDVIIAPNQWVLGWEGTYDFYQKNKKWLIDLGLQLGVPTLFKLSREMNHYYAMKNEFQVILKDGANIQISTVQWDVKDGKRFNIGYTDENGLKCPSPVILHASSFGSIERTLCAILEKIGMSAQLGELPSFPLWLSPTQVRIIPVSDRYVQKTCEICKELTKQFIRCDVDDRNKTVGRKVREAGRDWVPYSFVFGSKEESSMMFPVKCRYREKDISLSLDGLVKVIKKRVGHMPFRPLSLSHRLSLRPLFL